MGRTYKTGPARSRRRPDPSARWQPGQPVYPLNEQNSTPGAGTLTVVLNPVDLATGVTVQDSAIQVTGQASKAYFIAGGTRYPVDTVVWDGGLQEWTFTWSGGLPAGAGFVVVPFGDEFLRGTDGSWTGSYIDIQTIT